MSDFSVPVVRIADIQRHRNADTLSITQVLGEDVIIKTGDFGSGDLAIYVPVDAVVPPTVRGTEFLGDHRRIRAKRLRGVYSEGLLLPVDIMGPGDPEQHIGEDVSVILGIVKHEDRVPESMGGGVGGRRGLNQRDRDPGLPVYEIEQYKRHRNLLVPGERVIVTEKLHGTQGRYGRIPGRFGSHFYVGSHFCFWLDDQRWAARLENLWRRITRRTPREPNLYWHLARKYDLPSKLRGHSFEHCALYGEIYGDVQDLKYGARPGRGDVWFRVFDIYDSLLERWLDWDQVQETAADLGLDTVPVLYDGPFSADLLERLVEGQSTLADHFREGVVVKPAVDREAQHFGRVILKWVSETYRLRRNGTELH
jgi:RNA ligase (TIGR02306 family)